MRSHSRSDKVLQDRGARDLGNRRFGKAELPCVALMHQLSAASVDIVPEAGFGPGAAKNNREEAMARMTGGAALVEMLCRHGVDTLFALPGVQNDALFEALY